jgi:hypothetical protein
MAAKGPPGTSWRSTTVQPRRRGMMVRPRIAEDTKSLSWTDGNTIYRLAK